MPTEAMQEAVTEALITLSEAGLAKAPEITARRIGIWCSVLETAGIDPRQVPAGTMRLLQTATFFPTPADFIAAVKPPEDRDAGDELAWQKVLSAVRRHGRMASLHISDFAGDGLALWALERMGWARLCAELGEENRAIWRAEFIRLYRAGRTTNARVEWVAGQAEIENGRHGRELTPAMVGRPEWLELPQARQALPEPSAEPGRLGEMRPVRELAAVAGGSE